MAEERWATFDCYGTLIDWMGGIRDTLSDLWPEHDAELLLSAYHEIEPEVQRGKALPYRQVLAESLERVAHREGLELADDELILGWRNSEWTGIAPFLEEDGKQPVTPQMLGPQDDWAEHAVLGWRIGVGRVLAVAGEPLDGGPRGHVLPRQYLDGAGVAEREEQQDWRHAQGRRQDLKLRSADGFAAPLLEPCDHDTAH